MCVMLSELALGVFVIVMLNSGFAIVHSLLFVLCRRMHRLGIIGPSIKKLLGAQAAGHNGAQTSGRPWMVLGSALASEWRQVRAATNCMVHHRAHRQIAQQIPQLWLAWWQLCFASPGL